MKNLEKEIEEWKEWLIEDLQKIMKTEIGKDVEILFDYLKNKRMICRLLSAKGGLMMFFGGNSPQPAKES